jgi:hypothetical protein
MQSLTSAYCAVRRQIPREETLFEAVMGILAFAWCGFVWYLVVWLVVGEPIERSVIQDEAQTAISRERG